MSASHATPGTAAVLFPKADVAFMQFLSSAFDYEQSWTDFHDRQENAAHTITECQYEYESTCAMIRILQSCESEDVALFVAERAARREVLNAALEKARAEESRCSVYLPRIVEARKRLWRGLYKQADEFVRNRLRSSIADGIAIVDPQTFCGQLRVLCECHEELERSDGVLGQRRRRAIEASEAVGLARAVLRDARSRWVRFGEAKATSDVDEAEAARKVLFDEYEVDERRVSAQKKPVAERERSFLLTLARPILEAAGRVAATDPSSPGSIDLSPISSRPERGGGTVRQRPLLVVSPARAKWREEQSNVLHYEERRAHLRSTHSASLASYLIAFRTSSQANFERIYTSRNNGISFLEEDDRAMDQWLQASIAYDVAKMEAIASGEEDLPLSPVSLAERSDPHSESEIGDRQHPGTRIKVSKWGRRVARQGTPIDPRADTPAEVGSSSDRHHSLHPASPGAIRSPLDRQRNKD
ncbi:hypothetical protein LTR85_002501 [Meristemomyces frigidus]|nr:hypothetical protein LTR85_002501 [Meristemomyces frigidus]